MSAMHINTTPENTIVVTGMGSISAAGSGVDALWQQAIAGESPAKWLHGEPVGIAANEAVSAIHTTRRSARQATVAAHVLENECPNVPVCAIDDSWITDVNVKRFHRMDRSVRLALNAAIQAIEDARLQRFSPTMQSVGIMVGTSRGPIHTNADFHSRRTLGKSIPACSSAHTTIACVSGAVAFALGAAGPSQTVSATCASGAHAIIAAAQNILLGNASIMIAGGTEAPLIDAVFQQMLATGVLGSHDDPKLACRPFDRDRNGTVLGEGAGFLVLESLASAIERGVTIHARLAGWATGTDCVHETAPSKDGLPLVEVMQRALNLARLQPKDLGYINLHGTGTVLNDSTESAAVKTLLGSAAAAVPCSSTKPITGHCLGAAAVLEAVISIMALKSQEVPPSVGCLNVSDECQINIATNQTILSHFDSSLSNSVGFWGNNASLVFTR